MRLIIWKITMCDNYWNVLLRKEFKLTHIHKEYLVKNGCLIFWLSSSITHRELAFVQDLRKKTSGVKYYSST